MLTLPFVVSQTENYSFSDLTALARDAALGPIRRKDCQIIFNFYCIFVIDLNMESVRSIKPDQVENYKIYK